MSAYLVCHVNEEEGSKERDHKLKHESIDQLELVGDGQFGDDHKATSLSAVQQSSAFALDVRFWLVTVFTSELGS